MPVIQVEHLHKRYGEKVAVEDVSFEVERGEIFGILGPNGAGKTTTVECLEGLRVPDGGTLSVLGLDPRRDRAELRQRVGVQLQDSRLQDKPHRAVVDAVAETDMVPGVWQSSLTRVERYLPYALLAVATAISFGIGHHDGRWWAPPRLREHPAFALLTFVGIIGLGSVLEARDITFLIFVIFAFLAALRLRPTWLAYAGLGATSLLINTLGNGGPVHALRERPGVWITLVLVQTVAIGGGATLSAAVARQNEQRRRTLDELAAAHAENEGLQRQLLSQAREAGMLDERQRLAQEIHDTLAQGFTGIITQLEAAALAKEHPAEWQRHLDSATALARENLTAARRSVRALHPEPLDTATLPHALADVAARWSERTGVPATCTATGDPRELHPEIEATILRITQEALSNVDKHATADRVGLTLSYMADEVTLDVRDDGVGFEPASEDGGFGLPGMRRRVRRLAGTLHVESEPGAGTAISVALPAVPLPPEAPA